MRFSLLSPLAVADALDWGWMASTSNEPSGKKRRAKRKELAGKKCVNWLENNLGKGQRSKNPLIAINAVNLDARKLVAESKFCSEQSFSSYQIVCKINLISPNK